MQDIDKVAEQYEICDVDYHFSSRLSNFAPGAASS
jgi:hypothetical protein